MRPKYEKLLLEAQRRIGFLYKSNLDNTTRKILFDLCTALLERELECKRLDKGWEKCNDMLLDARLEIVELKDEIRDG